MEKEGVWMALPIAVVEDQIPDAQRLEELLQQQLPEAECTWFACGDDFLRAAAEPGLYAVVFLDICMAGTNGIETARRLRQADPEVLIVFVTSSPEYVWDAFPVHPFDYLLKPYQEEKFEHLAAELRRALRCKEPELEIRIARQSIQLPLRKVLYAIARNHYVLITTEGRVPCHVQLCADRRKAYRTGKLYELQPGRYHQHGQGAAVRGGLHRDLGRYLPAGTAKG